MPEFTIEIDSHENSTRSEDVLEKLSELLVENDAVLGPSASLNTSTGVIGATFQVAAETFEEAVRLGVAHFAHALAAATGVPATELGGYVDGEEHEQADPIDKVLIERVADHELVPA